MYYEFQIYIGRYIGVSRFNLPISSLLMFLTFFIFPSSLFIYLPKFFTLIHFCNQETVVIYFLKNILSNTDYLSYTNTFCTLTLSITQSNYVLFSLYNTLTSPYQDFSSTGKSTPYLGSSSICVLFFYILNINELSK